MICTIPESEVPSQLVAVRYIQKDFPIGLVGKFVIVNSFKFGLLITAGSFTIFTSLKLPPIPSSINTQ